MSIKKSNFTPYFHSEKIPVWVCPYCDTGTLQIVKDHFNIIQSADSFRNQKTPEHEPEWDYGFFIGKLHCSNLACDEFVHFSGEAKMDFTGHDDSIADDYDQTIPTYDWLIKPKYFSIPIKLFEFSNKYPKKVTDILNKAFGLYWFDPSSCGNKIRSALEKLMDLRKVKKGRLHNRIVEFQKLEPDAGTLVEAAKWIGNEGSHKDDNLNHKQLLAAFEFVEEALNILYNTHNLTVRNRAQRINSKYQKPK